MTDATLAPPMPVPTSNPILADSVIALKGEAVIEAADIASVHLQWTCRHLSEGRREKAVEAFNKFLSATRVAAAEMQEIGSALQRMNDGPR